MGHILTWLVQDIDKGGNFYMKGYESGMYGYGGQSDYSDFSNLKEYVLHGIGSESESIIFHSTPMPLNISDEDSPE